MSQNILQPRMKLKISSSQNWTRVTTESYFTTTDGMVDKMR